MVAQEDTDAEMGAYSQGEPAAAAPSSFRESFFHEGSNRTGKSLLWSQIDMKLMSASKGKKKNKGSAAADANADDDKVEKHILRNLWGEAKAGETTAIMGASGAGKTSLFNILAGRAKSRGRIQIQANDIRLGGSLIDPNSNLQVRNLFAFVAQQDALHEPSTPRQALTFSARLRLPKSTTKKEIDVLVNTYIHELGLESCCDSLIGGELKKGISGGEKRRVSIGVELIAQPTLIFLDEPTSGLDSFAARQVMKLLQKVANAGNTVLFTIHQPSSDVFASFDRLILLHKGELMYQGLVSEVKSVFDQNGFPLPDSYNPADWVLDVAQTNEVADLKSKGFFPEDTRTLAEANTKLEIPKRQHVSLWTELCVLVFREKTSFVKNPAPLIINAAITGFLSVVFGVIFFQIGAADQMDPIVVQSQLGALININISTMMGQSQTALMTFAAERPLFLREYSTDHFSIITYFISHLATEAIQSFVAMMIQALIVYFMIGFQQTFLQFFFVTYSLAMTSTAVAVLLGSFVSDQKSAASLFTLVVVPQFYFSGVFIAINLIPSWVRWAKYLCSLFYGANLSFAYEFGDCPEGTATTNCERTLAQNGVDPDDVWWYWLALAALFVGFRVSAMVVLQRKGSDFGA